jgi:hypothetical protein
MDIYQCPFCHEWIKDNVKSLIEHREKDGPCDRIMTAMREKKEGEKLMDYTATNDEMMKGINVLVELQILGPELDPDPNYCHWPVLQPERLPSWAEISYNSYGEIRLYEG